MLGSCKEAAAGAQLWRCEQLSPSSARGQEGKSNTDGEGKPRNVSGHTSRALARQVQLGETVAPGGRGHLGAVALLLFEILLGPLGSSIAGQGRRTICARQSPALLQAGSRAILWCLRATHGEGRGPITVPCLPKGGQRPIAANGVLLVGRRRRARALQERRAQLQPAPAPPREPQAAWRVRVAWGLGFHAAQCTAMVVSRQIGHAPGADPFLPSTNSPAA